MQTKLPHGHNANIPVTLSQLRSPVGRQHEPEVQEKISEIEASIKQLNVLLTLFGHLFEVDEPEV